ncbi:hypothetical protein AB4Z22_00105 [Paenibacillus sp. TAF58]
MAIGTDPDIHALSAYLQTLDPATRGDIIRKLKLFAKCDAKPFQTVTNTLPSGKTVTQHLPPLSRLDVVHCDFTGVGFEWDGPHYAVVWNVNSSFDSVTVIPTTSESREEHANVFCVSQITGLPVGRTTLLISDTTTVSRKRIEPVKFTHPKRGTVQSAKVPQSWTERIIQGMAVTFESETTFQEFVIHKTGTAMPADLSLLHSWRFMPVRGTFDGQNNVLNYRIWNKDNYHTTAFILPKQQISVDMKKALVRNLLSNDATVQSAAETQYKAWYTE